MSQPVPSEGLQEGWDDIPPYIRDLDRAERDAVRQPAPEGLRETPR